MLVRFVRWKLVGEVIVPGGELVLVMPARNMTCKCETHVHLVPLALGQSFIYFFQANAQLALRAGAYRLHR